MMELWFKTVPGFSQAGCFSLIADLIGGAFGTGETKKTMHGIGVTSGIIQKSGNWFLLGEEKFNGVAAFAKYLSQPENIAVRQTLRAQVQQWIEDHGRD